MDENKKYGRSGEHAKHLRKKKGKWTKPMANKKSRSKVKLDVKIDSFQQKPISVLNYEGYKGTVNYSSVDKVYFGKIANIRDLVTFEAKTLIGVKRAFKKCLVDYLITCKALAKKPQRT